MSGFALSYTVDMFMNMDVDVVVQWLRLALSNWNKGIGVCSLFHMRTESDTVSKTWRSLGRWNGYQNQEIRRLIHWFLMVIKETKVSSSQKFSEIALSNVAELELKVYIL
jgi:hypothetical protein